MPLDIRHECETKIQRIIHFVEYRQSNVRYNKIDKILYIYISFHY